MPDINPISNQEDILNEANANMQQPTVVVQTQTQIQDTSIAVLIDTPNVIEPSPQINSQPTAPVTPPVAAPQMVVNRIVEVKDKASFNYRLPVFSYVLVWFYIVAAVVIGGFVVYYLYVMNKYTSSSYYSSSSTASTYNSIIYPLSLVIAGCVAVIISLLNGTKTNRYVAIAISIILVGFEVYGVYRLAISMSGYYNFGETIVMYFSYYGVFMLPLLQYILLPVVTVAYLFTPKAVRAYN